MKKITLKTFLLGISIAFAGSLQAQVANQIELEPLVGGKAANHWSNDNSTITIDGKGVVSISGDAKEGWATAETTGTVSLAGAQNKTFKIYLEAIAEVNKSGGKKLGRSKTKGGVHRFSNGVLGVRQNGGSGIQDGEGYLFGFDASLLDPSVTIQITEIGLGAFLTSTEQATFVNRLDTSKKLVVTGGLNNYKDVSALGLYVKGGVNLDAIVSVFGSDTSSNFTISGIRFKIVDSSTLPGL